MRCLVILLAVVTTAALPSAELRVGDLPPLASRHAPAAEALVQAAVARAQVTLAATRQADAARESMDRQLQTVREAAASAVADCPT